MDRTVDRLEGLMAVPWEAPMVDLMEGQMEGQTVDRSEVQREVCLAARSVDRMVAYLAGH